MSLDLTRRKLFAGVATLIAAPTIVRVANIMPVRSLPEIDGSVFEYAENAIWHHYSGYDVLNVTKADMMKAMQFDWAKLVRGWAIEARGFA